MTLIKQTNSDGTVVWWGGLNASSANSSSTPFSQFVALVDSTNTQYGSANPFPVSLPAPTTSYRAIGSLAGNVKSSAGVLWSVACTNLNAATRYLQIFNNASTPSGTPLETYPVYGNVGFLVLDSLFFGNSGLSLSTGITLGFSTTATTYTAGSAGDCIVIARYT